MLALRLHQPLRTTLQRVPAMARAFRVSKPAPSASSAEMVKEFFSAADHSTGLSHLYHKLNIGLCALTPLALLLSPSAMNLPVDLALGVGIPVHFQISGHGLITDYAPLLFGNGLGKAVWFVNTLRAAMTATTAVANVAADAKLLTQYTH